MTSGPSIPNAFQPSFFFFFPHSKQLMDQSLLIKHLLTKSWGEGGCSLLFLLMQPLWKQPY